MRLFSAPHPQLSVITQVLQEKGVVLRDEGEFINRGFKVLFPGVTNVREILPNSTAIDAT
jgi:hypothetical protein